MKIFRKSRFSAITKTSVSKYVLYAIGEIILVVIGILIALYLNNKKEISDRLEKQETHLVLIKEELKNNLLILKKEDEELGRIIINIRAIINLSNSKQSRDTISEINLSGMLFLPLTRAIDTKYENGAFNEFITSNGLKDLRNDSIKNMLRSWEKKLRTLDQQENVVKESLDNAVNFVQINGSLKTIFDNTGLSETYFKINGSSTTDSNKHLLEDKQFENILLQYLGVTIQLYEKNYPPFESEVNSLISLIEKELNN